MVAMKNVIEQPIEVNDLQSDLDDATVQSFIQLQEKWSNSSIRTDKMTEIEEDKEILEELNETLNTDERPQMKPSLYFKLMRIYDIQASELPKTYARKKGISDVELSLVNSLKDHIYDEAGAEDVYVDVIQRFKAEGTAVVQIGFDDEGNYIPIETCELGEIYIDPKVDSIATHVGMKGRVARTVIRAAKVKYGEFLQYFPDMEGKVSSGTPGTEEVFAVEDKDMTGNRLMDDKDELTVLYCYSVEKGEPTMAIFAGSTGALCEPVRKGKDYPFWRKRRGRDVAFLPFVDFHYSRMKRGFYSMSMIGMMKDIAESFRKMLNSALPVFAKIVNPLLFLFGATDDQTIEEMQLAYEQQKLGMNPMIASEEGVSMQAVSPNSNIFTEFINAKQIVFAEASDRFDIDFQRLSGEAVKATVFVGKTKTELQAIAGLYTINKVKFDLLAEYTMALASKHWSLKDPRIINIAITEDDYVPLSIGRALQVFKEFEGYFDTDTDLRMPTSTVDKANAMTEMEQLVYSTFYGRPFTSAEEISVEIQALAYRARLRDIDDVYTVAALEKKANLVLQGRQQPPQQGTSPDGSLTATNPANEDVAQELSPNTALAEAAAGA